MKSLMLATAVFLVTWALLGFTSPMVTQAHPGNTDSYGCHVCRTNCTERWGIPYGFYHRHNPVRACFEDTFPGLWKTERVGTASSLSLVAQGCSGAGRVTVTFSWVPSLIGDGQWVDLTLFNNGFVWGTFLGAGPILMIPWYDGVYSYTWEGLLPNTTHYWRVNTFFGPYFIEGRWLPENPWMASATYTFVTRAC